MIQMLIFGYAATFEVFTSPPSFSIWTIRRKAGELLSRFHLQRALFDRNDAQNQADVTNAIDSSDAAVAIAIQPGFAELLRKGADRAS